MINPPKSGQISNERKINIHIKGELINLIDATGRELGLYGINVPELIRKICQTAIRLNIERNLYKEKLLETLKDYNEYLFLTEPKIKP